MNLDETPVEIRVEIRVEEFTNLRDRDHPGKVVPRVWRAMMVVLTPGPYGTQVVANVALLVRWSPTSAEHARRKAQRAMYAERAREQASIAKCFAIAGVASKGRKR